MRTSGWSMVLGLAALLCAGAAHAGDAPAAPSGDVPTGGGIKELPGTIQHDTTDAVKKVSDPAPRPRVRPRTMTMPTRETTTPSPPTRVITGGSARSEHLHQAGQHLIVERLRIGCRQLDATQEIEVPAQVSTEAGRERERGRVRTAVVHGL